MGKEVDADTDTDRCSRLIRFECTFCADRGLSEALRSQLISMHIYMCDHLLRLIPRLWSARFRALISHDVDERSTHPFFNFPSKDNESHSLHTHSRRGYLPSICVPGSSFVARSVHTVVSCNFDKGSPWLIELQAHLPRPEVL
jgi:hypothetical protein